MMRNAQRRIAEPPADRETQPPGRNERRRERAAGLRQQRHRIGPDADKGALRERYLPGIAERQVEPHRGDGQHRPHRDQEDAERLEKKRGGDGENRSRGGRGRTEPAHTVRSSKRPSKPWGRSRMTATRIISGNAPRYWDDR